MSNDFNIPRFIKFMEDLEQGRIPEYNRKIIVEENTSNFIDMLVDKNLLSESTGIKGNSLSTDIKGNSFSQEAGGLLSKALGGIGSTLKSLGFGIMGMTKNAIEDLDIPILTDRKAKKRFAKATNELYKSYRVDLYNLVEVHAREFKAYGSGFTKELLELLAADDYQEKSFIKSNKRTFIDMKADAEKYVKKLKSLIPEKYSKYSIKEYMVAVKKDNREQEFNKTVGEYMKWVEITTKEKLLPMIKDFSSYIMVEYIKHQNQNPDTVEESFKTADSIYKLFEELEGE